MIIADIVNIYISCNVIDIPACSTLGVCRQLDNMIRKATPRAEK